MFIMSPRTVEQNKEIRAEKRALIIETGLKLFADKGFHATSITNITKTAGISKGLLYNYFDSKEDLLRRIIFDYVEGIAKTFFNEHGEDMSKKKFLSLLEKNFAMIKEKPLFWKLYYALVSRPVVLKIIGKEIEEIMSGIFGELAKYFEHEGWDNPLKEAMYCESLMDGIFMNYLNDPDHFPIDYAKKQLISRYK